MHEQKEMHKELLYFHVNCTPSFTDQGRERGKPPQTVVLQIV